MNMEYTQARGFEVITDKTLCESENENDAAWRQRLGYCLGQRWAIGNEDDYPFSSAACYENDGKGSAPRFLFEVWGPNHADYIFCRDAASALDLRLKLAAFIANEHTVEHLGKILVDSQDDLRKHRAEK